MKKELEQNKSEIHTQKQELQFSFKLVLEHAFLVIFFQVKSEVNQYV